MSCGEREKAAKTEHTPEPWFVVDQPWGDGTWVNAGSPDPHHEGFVTDCEDINGDVDKDTARINARRIVACVNACAGLSNEFLSVATRDDYAMRLVLEADEMRRQRDELLAALRPLITQRMGAEQIREGIQRAIASVKGETS